MKGGMIVLADIAASTLGIALLLLITIANLREDTPIAINRAISSTEISDVYQPITGPPLSSSDMVTLLHNRTRQTSDRALMLDAFSNRVVVSGHDVADPQSSTTIMLDQHDFDADLMAILTQDNPITVFVFDTKTQNRLHRPLRPVGAKQTNVTVPAALRSVDLSGHDTWHPDFAALMKQRLSRQEFVEILTQILVRAQTDDAASQFADGRNVVGGFLHLSTRLYAILTTILTALFFGCTLGVICLIERQTRSEK